MRLAACAFRQLVHGSGQMRCTLVQRVLGLASPDGCIVNADACRACAKLDVPQPARLNAVVSSLVYNLAHEIRTRGGQADCDFGAAWQAECYARATLAEYTGVACEPARCQIPILQRLTRRIPRPKLSAPRRRRSPIIGLVGYGTASGLGYLNHDLAHHGAIDSWLLAEHPRLPLVSHSAPNCRIVVLQAGTEERIVRHWLRELDWVVWAEASPLPSLPHLARRMGVRVACIPMWEWTSPTAEWLRAVDLLICPTLHSYRMFNDWKHRFGFHWHVVHFPWPVSSERFHFRLRMRCEKFVFVNGHGGTCATDIETAHELGPRKGLDIILAAAALTPKVPWIIYTQDAITTVTPANVEVRQGPADHAALYSDGDVCVQPSRWEGIGLPLLECQMAGMPLVTVDAPPMNEYRALRRISPTHWEWGFVAEGQPIRIPVMSPEQLAGVVCELHRSDIRAASTEARQRLRSERSWDQAATHWRRIFEECPRRAFHHVNQQAIH